MHFVGFACPQMSSPPPLASIALGLGAGGGAEGAPLSSSPAVQGDDSSQLAFTLRKGTRVQASGLASTPATAVPNAAAAPAPVSSQLASTPAQTTPHPPAFPAIHLAPLNDTFVPKQIALSPPGTRIKIGRQTNLKTVPNGTNGYFDSKVLSRMHAEVWSDHDKVIPSLLPSLACHSSLITPLHVAPLLSARHSSRHVGLHQGRQIFERNFYQRRTTVAGSSRERSL